jgi:hypothetical protein
MAVCAGLGFLILSRAEREERRVRLAGRAAGWILLVGGLAGFLLGLARFACPRCGDGRRDGLPPWHPRIEEMAPDGGRKT